MMTHCSALYSHLLQQQQGMQKKQKTWDFGMSIKISKLSQKIKF